MNLPNRRQSDIWKGVPTLDDYSNLLRSVLQVKMIDTKFVTIGHISAKRTWIRAYTNICELSTSAEIEKAGNVGSVEEFYIVQTSASFLHL